MRPPEFALLPRAELLEHEEVDALAVRALTERIEADGVVRDPIWVARESLVILNGHHRFHALTLLGAHRVPAWLFDYGDPGVVLERWSPGPLLTKEDVVARARSGVPFPPKTTRHVLRYELPERSTTLAELRAPGPAQPRAARPSAGRSPSR